MNDEKHSHEGECCGCGHDKEKAEQKSQPETERTLDVAHNPPTDRETLSDPEALDDLVDLRHLE